MDTNRYISKCVKELIKSNGLDFGKFYEKYNFDKDKFNNYLYNKSKWDIDVLKKLSEIFNTSIDYLAGKIENISVIQKIDTDKKTTPVPVYGDVYCGMPASQWDVNSIKRYIDVEDMPKIKFAFGLIAKGDSMSPYIMQNDFLICVDKPELIKNNKPVVVVFKGTIEDNEVNAKLISIDSRKGNVTLYSINSKYPPVTREENEILKIYKLIKIIRDVK